LTFARRGAHNLAVVRRWPSILLLVGFLALGSGLVENLHLRAHLLEHAGDAAAAPEQHDHNDGEDCGLCILLHLPALSAGWVPVLVCLGLFVAFLSLLSSRVAPQRVALRVDCRGPPVL
jgi:hypothetical protein